MIFVPSSNDWFRAIAAEKKAAKEANETNAKDQK